MSAVNSDYGVSSHRMMVSSSATKSCTAAALLSLELLLLGNTDTGSRPFHLPGL